MLGARPGPYARMAPLWSSQAVRARAPLARGPCGERFYRGWRLMRPAVGARLLIYDARGARHHDRVIADAGQSGVDRADRSHAVKLTTCPGSSFNSASPMKVTHAPA